MARGKLILICQSGGDFVTKDDGSLLYTGGEAHALDVNHETHFDDLKSELAEIWNYDSRTMSIKYFLPGNRWTLINISNDKDLKRMVDFHRDSVTADVYILARESTARDVPNMWEGRTKKARLSDTANKISPCTPAHATPAAAATIPADVSGTPIVTASPSSSLVLVDTNKTAGPADATISLDPTNASQAASIPAPDPACIQSSFVVASNATVPSHTGVAANSAVATTPNASIMEDIGKQKRTASWKSGGDGWTIISVSDDVRGAEDTSIFPITDAVEQLRDEIAMKDDINCPTITANCSDVGLQGVIASWKNCITGIGQQFSNIYEFRDTLRKYAVANHFVYQLKKNDSNRATAICRSEGCPWRIHASWVPYVQALRIKKMNKSHTCERDTGKSTPPTKHWLASIIKDRLRDSPHYKPKEILSDISRELGIELKYIQAWRGMDIAREQLRGSYEVSYNRLPWYCEKLMEMNPGTVAKLTTSNEKKFQHLFISFHASVCGFKNGCRPLVFLESVSLKSKYQEILLVATAVDGDDNIFPVAFAIVDVENHGNWHWFLEQLKSVLSSPVTLTFVSDREKGLITLVHEVFENAYHGYCIIHLEESFKKNWKGPFHGEGKGALPGYFLAAAHAPRLDGFKKSTEKIKTVSSEAYSWVMQIEPEYWANALFKGERYNQIPLDIFRTLNDWMVEVRELPIIQKIDALRCKLMELIFERRVDSSKWLTKLTPSKEEKLQEEALKARNLKVLFSSDSLFEVHDDCIHVVNIDEWDCSCLGWKVTGLPCCHAIAVFNCTHRSVYDYCSRYFLTDTFRLTYLESINPVPDIEKPVDKDDASDTVQLHPPRTYRSPSQQKRRRNKSKEGKKPKRSLTCSRCGVEGHNKATCKAS